MGDKQKEQKREKPGQTQEQEQEQKEPEKRKTALELAIKAAAACPDFFSRTVTNKERELGAMIVREAKTIYAYLYQAEKP